MKDVRVPAPASAIVACKARPAAKALLGQAAREVKAVWNFCNASTFNAWHGRYGGTRKLLAVVNTYDRIWVGNASAQAMATSGFRCHGKPVHDAAFGTAFHTLEAMGRRAGRVVKKVSECNSTRRCSACQALTGPAGLSACVVRQWMCGACRASHDRDANAGENLHMAGGARWQTRSPGNCDRSAAPRHGRPCAGTR